MLESDSISDAIAQRVARLQSALRDTTHRAVLAESSKPAELAALAIACWTRSRRVLFPPTLRESTLEELADRRDCVRASTLDVGDGEFAEGALVRFGVGNVADDFSGVLAEFHTSGSTGEPVCVTKGTHELVGEARMLISQFDLTPDDVLVSGVPGHHLYGFLFSVMIPMISGAGCVNETPLHAESVAALCAKTGATLFVSTPAQLRNCTTVSADRFSTCRRVFSSGAALRRDTRNELADKGLDITELFGSTETGGIAWRDGSSDGVWTPLPEVDVRMGEGDLLEIRSPFAGHPDSFRPTDDLVEMTDTGFHHRGRADDIVKIGGRRVSKSELEHRLADHDAVHAAEVLEVVEDEESKRLYAFAESDQQPEARVLRDHLLQWFEASTIPTIQVVSELPRTRMGKVTRETLRGMLDEFEPETPTTFTAFEPSRISDDTYEIELHIPEDSVYFEGHFETFPILPGVVQISEIALKLSLELWPDFEAPERILKLKFSAPIRPDETITLTLDRDRNEVAFRLDTIEQTCCRGQFVFPDGRDG